MNEYDIFVMLKPSMMPAKNAQLDLDDILSARLQKNKMEIESLTV